MSGFLPQIPFFSIHLESAFDRIQLMKLFEKNLERPILPFEASIGEKVLALGCPRKHPRNGETTVGELGCLESHVRLVGKLLPTLGVFEDDAELVGDIPGLNTYIRTVETLDPKWDIIFLGANEWVEQVPSSTGVPSTVVRIRRFWGTHAFLIRRSAAEKVITTYMDLLNKGFAYPADWLYTETILRYNLRVYGPANPRSFIRQKPGVVSSITGVVRD